MLGTNETFQDDAPLAEFWYEAIVWLRALSQRSLHGCLTHHLHWLRDRELCWRHCAYLDIREYLGQLVDRNLANATLTLYRWSIGKLYHWAHREGHRADNPMTCLAPMKRRERNLRWVPSLQHVERLLHEPNVHTALGVRDRCILELLYATGLRASELLGLQSWQISPRSRCIKIRGKGERERLVIYGEVATEWLEQYIHEARPYLLRQAGWERNTPSLFVQPTPSLSMNYMTLWRMVRSHAQRAGLPLMTPHALRHAFATHCKDAGMDLVTLQMLLGHASLSTTTIYVRTAMAQLRELLERHHPRGLLYQPFTRAKRGIDRQEIGHEADSMSV